MKKYLIAGIVALTQLANAAEPRLPVKAQLDDPESSSLILVPDPQSYIKWSATQPLFDLQTAWIASNIDRLNIKAALFTGDMVEQNNSPAGIGLPNGVNGDQSSDNQWKSVSRALERLDHRIPYMICQGNHDAGFASSENRQCAFPDYFPAGRNICWEKSLVATAPNYLGTNTLENAAYEIAMPGWGKILIIAWEFAPRDEILRWTKDLTESEKYKDHHVIILTHSFIEHDDHIFAEEAYALSPRNWPGDIMKKLIYPSKNIDLILCGHAGDVMPWPENPTSLDEIDYGKTYGFRIEPTADGREVPIMMFNSQTADGEWNGNGGDCWIRILEFKPDGKTIKVHTFSPLYAMSKYTKHLSRRRAPGDEFEFRIN